MKIRCFVGILFVLLMSGTVFAVDHYVSLVGTNNAPYTNWADAATNIQWAVNVATNGETVWVTNGTYYLTNHIAITSQVTVQSLNGYTNTIVLGNGANRCFFLTNRAVILGFTVTNGFAALTDYGGAGGGVYANGTCGVYNCFITGNRAVDSGGGLRLLNGSTAANCTVSANFATNSGGSAGGISAGTESWVTDCVIEKNVCTNRGGGAENSRATYIGCQFISNTTYGTRGGGARNGGFTVFSNCVFTGNSGVSGLGGGVAYESAGGMIIDCVFSNNSEAGGYGGAIYLGASAGNVVTAMNCTIVGNNSGDGAGVFVNKGGYIINCLIKDNYASWYGGGMRIDAIKNFGGYVSACTIISNYASATTNYGGGGIVFRDTNCNDSIYNCVVWSNRSANTNRMEIYYEVTTTTTNALWYTCVDSSDFPADQGNITNHPQFLDFSGGNYRLSVNSPCVNAGTNQAWMTNAFDLDGKTRIRYGTVDMGVYETIYNGTIYRIP